MAFSLSLRQQLCPQEPLTFCCGEDHLVSICDKINFGKIRILSRQATVWTLAFCYLADWVLLFENSSRAGVSDMDPSSILDLSSGILEIWSLNDNEPPSILSSLFQLTKLVKHIVAAQRYANRSLRFLLDMKAIKTTSLNELINPRTKHLRRDRDEAYKF